ATRPPTTAWRENVDMMCGVNEGGGRMSLARRFEEVREGFERSFWVANVSEIFERLAYYGSFASLANYLRETLNFPTQQTGTLTGIFCGVGVVLGVFL